MIFLRFWLNSGMTSAFWLDTRRFGAARIKKRPRFKARFSILDAPRPRRPMRSFQIMSHCRPVADVGVDRTARAWRRLLASPRVARSLKLWEQLWISLEHRLEVRGHRHIIDIVASARASRRAVRNSVRADPRAARVREGQHAAEGGHDGAREAGRPPPPAPRRATRPRDAEKNDIRGQYCTGGAS